MSDEVHIPAGDAPVVHDHAGKPEEVKPDGLAVTVPVAQSNGTQDMHKAALEQIKKAQEDAKAKREADKKALEDEHKKAEEARKKAEEKKAEEKK